MDFPEDLTYRQALEEYRGVWYPEDEPLTLSDYKELITSTVYLPEILISSQIGILPGLMGSKDSSNARAYRLPEPLIFLTMTTSKGALLTCNS